MSVREVRSVWEAINSGSYKQAQAKISKELKKSPDNAYYQALNSLVLLRLNKRDQALEVARKIAAAGVPNSHVLHVTGDVFQELDLIDEINSMYEAANRKDPQSTEIVSNWFDSMIENSHIKGLAKVAMAHQRSSGASRESTFTAVFHMYLAHSRGVISDSEKKLYPMLAHRMLDKVQPYETAQEVYVHALSLKMNDSPDPLVNYLLSDDVKTKWNSLDLQVMLLETLKDCKRYKELYDECQKAISAEKDLDSTNWLHWQAMVEAAAELGGDHLRTMEEFIKAFPKPTRNARLAMVKLASVKSSDMSLFDKVVEYFEYSGAKRVAFEDLRPFVTCPDFDEAKFVEWLKDASAPSNCDDWGKLNWNVNVAKFNYLLAPQQGDHVTANIKRYHDSTPLLKDKDPKDYHSGDDFLLIAASELMNQKDKVSLCKAALILELAAKSDRHQFYVRQWLVRIYILLGAFARAKAHYDSLSIKMVQLETLSYMLTTRLSTISPDSAVLQSTYGIARQAYDFVNYIKFSYNGAYTQIEGFMDLHYKFSHSLNKALVDLETVKLERLTTDNANTKFIEATNTSVALEDNRDFDSMWNCNGPDEVPLSQVLTVGPVQKSEWAHAFQIREKIIRKLVPGGDELKTLVKALEDIIKHHSSQFTDEELWALETIILVANSAQSKESKEGYSAVEQKLSSMALDEQETGQWKWFHRAFTILETCNVVSGYMIRLKTNRNQVKANLDASEALRSAISAITKKVKEQALQVKNSRNQTFQHLTGQLSPWAQENGISASLVEEVVDGICAASDKSITVLRNCVTP
uniref:ARAD1A17842p n=1 Tax=Blastobotrys adeninivorans TaxID=409370 RepID=A0A060T3P9_BLAAD